MDDLRLHAVAARVVAWHNRHPLARRITAAQVCSIGYVALPFVTPGNAAVAVPVSSGEPAMALGAGTGPGTMDGTAAGSAPDLTLEVHGAHGPQPAPARDGVPARDPEPAPEPAAPPTPGPALAPGASLRERAVRRALLQPSTGAAAPAPRPSGPARAAGAAGGSRLAAFTEDFIAPLSPRRVARWALRHGTALVAEPADGPIRRVQAAAVPRADTGELSMVWVATAAIECDGRRARLLLGAGAVPAVLGRRLWSRARLGGTFAATLLLVATTGWQSWPRAVEAPTLAATEPRAQIALEAPGAASSAASLPPQPSRTDALAAPPAEVEPRAGSVALPTLRPALDEATKATARSAVAALRATRPAAAQGRAAANDDGPPEPVAVAATSLPTASAAAAAQAGSAAAPARAALFGLTTRLLRTRAESEQMQAALQSLLVTGGSRLRVEMLPVGEDWRVVCWPFERRDDAERARASLLARGIRLDTVDF